MNTSTVRADEAAIARPKYYEMDGALRANANRAWLLAFLTIPIALVAIGFAIFVRMQPPTVIRIGPNGDASVLGKPAKGAVSDLATGGTDEFLDEAFVKRFLTSYLNYSPTDVDDHWAGSLNMMTRNLRAYTLKALGDDDTRGKIDDGQVQSVFHLREIDAVAGEPLSLGTNWWAMNSHDTSDPYCFRRTAAWFNAAALMSGRRLHHSAIFPGQIRFNSKSGFDPEFPLRAIGKIFQCSPPRQFAGKMHLLFERRTSETMPDACLVTLRSSEHGAIQFGKPGWKSSGVSPISISLRGDRYEAMLLFGDQDWVESDLGRWQVDQSGCRVRLNVVREGALQ